MNKPVISKTPREQLATAEVLLLCSMPLIVVLYHSVIDAFAMLMR